jgi:hypothetical protein
MPLYRDIEPGLSGSDVAALQRMLADLHYYRSKVTGNFEQGTLDALTKLFHATGYDLPKLDAGQLGLPLADTASLPVSGLRVIRAAAIGTVLGEPSRTDEVAPALVEVEVASAALTARVDLLQADAFQAGRSVMVRVGDSESVASVVESVSEFNEAASSQPAGYDIVVPLPEKLAAASDQVATIAEVADAIPDGPAVPLVSIRQDAHGPYVLVQATNAVRQVWVTIRGQSEGYALVEESTDLPPGALVIVSGATWPPQQ